LKKTSLTHPLIIDYVNVPGTSGIIGMTLCPGKVQNSSMSGEWERDLDLDMGAIVAWGASALVTLMQPHEFKAFGVEALPERIPSGLNHYVLPILDGGTPDKPWENTWKRVGPEIRGHLKQGHRIIIHCRGGLGRTGLLTARILIEFGLEARRAIEIVRRARPGAIENWDQEHYVLRQKVAESLPVRPALRISPDRRDQFQGCLLGGAVGDALGAPVEFLKLTQIREKFGNVGIRDFSPAYGRLGAITDDTQMTLFTGEGVLRAHVRGKRRGLSSIPGVVSHAYQRWLITQETTSPVMGLGTDGWLLTHDELYSTRAPGTTCLSALEGYQNLGDPGPADNNSKGCGGIMRVAPVGLYVAACGLASGTAFEWGRQVAAITHGHPTGQLPAAVMALLVCEVTQGRSLPEALRTAKDLLQRQPDHDETLAAIEAAEQFASSQESSDDCLAKLGQGWVAEEALALSLFCALRATSLEEGVVMAVNITGDSDSTGAITGNLLGAMLGLREIPDRWLDQVELKQVLQEMADDLASVHDWAVSEFGQDGPEKQLEQDYWYGRYPGW
jgi:ADP-ribosylglycohydrolase/protein-tyrosine phosphatase